MLPTKRITDPSFVYVPSVKTDIRATFQRIREEMAKQQQAEYAGICLDDESSLDYFNRYIAGDR